MKKLLVFLCVSLLGLSGAVLQADRRIRHIPAEADAKYITPVQSSKLPNAEQNSVRLVDVATIPLNYDAEYFGNFRFHKNGNIYFTASFPTVEGTGRNIIIRFNPATEQYENITPRSPASKKKLKFRAMQDFDIDQSGNIYIATAQPESIVIQGLDGSFISQIALENFLPVKISVDMLGNIWVGGKVVLSQIPRNLGESQIRVYDASGRLVGIPAGGFTEIDLSTGVFLHEGSDTKFMAGKKPLTYCFSNKKLTQVEDYPYAVFSEISNSLQERTDSPVPQQSVQDKPTRILLGVSSVNGYLAWYGMLPDKDHGGVFNQSFIGLTSPSGQALTPEIVLPREYRSPVGIDYQGNMYFLSKASGQNALRKTKLIIERVTQ